MDGILNNCSAHGLGRIDHKSSLSNLIWTVIFIAACGAACYANVVILLVRIRFFFTLCSVILMPTCLNLLCQKNCRIFYFKTFSTICWFLHIHTNRHRLKLIFTASVQVFLGKFILSVFYWDLLLIEIFTNNMPIFFANPFIHIKISIFFKTFFNGPEHRTGFSYISMATAEGVPLPQFMICNPYPWKFNNSEVTFYFVAQVG